tara:strand:+ start:118 stop:627 length:510 start_codon:yes stop_codon:yes gene_type:complete
MGPGIIFDECIFYDYANGDANSFKERIEDESFNDFIQTMSGLFEQHYDEIAHYKQIELSIDIESYRRLARAGFLKIFTAIQSGNVIGYAVFIVKKNMRYSQSLQAVQDVLFIQKDKRGFGAEFIKYCDERLKEKGVQVVYHHVKAKHDFSPLLERQGYELIDKVYGREL